eukprot:scaffold29502_cov69-Cyclotella_meneghiniana.AAC.1
MSESQSQSPENPLDVTTEMMSQTTSALLANMALNASLNGSGSFARDSSATDIINSSNGRRALHDLPNKKACNNTISRVIGPHETLYKQKFDGFVTKTIRSYAARGGPKLPKYKQMNEREKVNAMKEIDTLLQRLNCASASSSASTSTTQTRSNANETFGSATTMGQPNETFGSATTLGEDPSLLSTRNKTRSQSISSETTMGDGRKSLATLNQSVSLLEESMILLSDEDEAEAESRFSGGNSPISPIERTRHASKPRESTLLDIELSSPSFSRSSKRCASNSGKRGFKSRVRLEESQDDAETSLLKHFEDNAGEQEDLFCEEDAFSCGSPIQRRFSCDLEDYDGNDAGKSEYPKQKKENDEESSRFSLQDVDFGNDDGDYDGFDEDIALDSLHPAYQQSQWNTFQNADPKLTHSDGEDEDDSPVRRRAIRFDGQSQRLASSKKHHSSIEDKGEDDSEISQKMADIVVGDNDANDDGDDDDPIQTVRNLSRRAKALESQGVNSSLLEEVAPTDIRLRDGAHYRIDPLRCRQTKDKGSKSTKKQPKSVKNMHPKNKSKVAAAKQYESESDSLSDPEPSFTDPITRFPTRVAARLNGAFEFITNKERDSRSDFQNDSINDSCGVLLSMPIDQCVSLTSKLLIQNIKAGRAHQRSTNGLSKKANRYTPNVHLSQEKDVLAGGTLIVLRDKGDLPQWEVALREYTSLSVMNHAELQANLRKLANTAAKCAGFDVVLSTYDAIKAKEVTVPVDENGRAMLDADATDTDVNDGWLVSRVAGSQTGAQAPRKCHQLSVLHRMSWHRLIMMDVLGRKGFLIKPGTARAQAAVALNSMSR